ncbi:hypothetical protein P692DRAFT_20603505 [Suillus brevipes Sb2]|nr:hypothetical protein P692DRAFT_20603505 [Suillus brevipes Sb2]
MQVLRNLTMRERCLWYPNLQTSPVSRARDQWVSGWKLRRLGTGSFISFLKLCPMCHPRIRCTASIRIRCTPSIRIRCTPSIRIHCTASMLCIQNAQVC